MNFKNELFLNGSLQLSGHVVLKDNAPTGVLKPAVVFGKNTNSGFSVFGPRGIYSFEDDSPDAFWDALIRSDSILYGSESEINQVVNILNDPIFSRNFSYLSMFVDECSDLIEMKNKIVDATISFVGCGGVGSTTSLILAGMGVKKIKLVDFDIIETSNLNRQLFFTLKDVGRYKVDVLEEQIQKRFPHVETESHFYDCRKKGQLELAIEGSDVALVTADDPISIIYSAVESCKKLGVKMISSGYLVNQLKVSYLNDYNLTPRTIWSRGPNFIAPSYSPSNIELSGVASSVIVLALLDKIPKESIPFTKIWNNYDY